MDAIEAIMTRRSVPKPAPGRTPSRDEITVLLDAAVRAPTHHLTQPWRFVVLVGTALRELGDAWAEGEARLGGDPEKVRDKPLRAPVVIAVIERPKTHVARVVEVEEHHATGAAIQNILLAAHASGLGAMIRTGAAGGLPEVRHYLGVADDEIVAAFIYVGYPPGDDARPPTRRTPAGELTEWRGTA